jgi:hypothetical protein
MTDFDTALARLRSWADAARDVYSWLFVVATPPAPVLEAAQQLDQKLEHILAQESLSHWRSWANGQGVSAEQQDVAGRVLGLLEAAVAELVWQRLEEGAAPQRQHMAALELAAALGRHDRPGVAVRPQVSHVVRLEKALLAREDERGW